MLDSVLQLDKSIVVVLEFKLHVHLVNLLFQPSNFGRVLEVLLVLVPLNLHMVLLPRMVTIQSLLLHPRHLRLHLVDQHHQF